MSGFDLDGINVTQLYKNMVGNNLKTLCLIKIVEKHLDIPNDKNIKAVIQNVKNQNRKKYVTYKSKKGSKEKKERVIVVFLSLIKDKINDYMCCKNYENNTDDLADCIYVDGCVNHFNISGYYKKDRPRYFRNFVRVYKFEYAYEVYNNPRYNGNIGAAYMDDFNGNDHRLGNGYVVFSILIKMGIPVKICKGKRFHIEGMRRKIYGTGFGKKDIAFKLEDYYKNRLWLPKNREKRKKENKKKLSEQDLMRGQSWENVYCLKRLLWKKPSDEKKLEIKKQIKEKKLEANNAWEERKKILKFR